MGYSSWYGLSFSNNGEFELNLLLIILVNFSFYSADNLTSDVAWIPNKHYSGVYGLLKLTLPKALPQSVEKVIVFDCDVTFSADVADLWSVFSLFSANQVFQPL